MKKLRNITVIAIIVIISTIFSINVFGLSLTYTMNVSGPDNVIKGSNITLTYSASNLGPISNGFAAYEGYINYDSSKLEFVNATNSINGWVIYTNKLDKKIKFMGYDDTPPNNSKNVDTELFKVTFKVLSNASSGNTVITMTNLKGSTGQGNSIKASDFSKTISIGSSPTSKSSNANLKSIEISKNSTKIALVPQFNKDTTNYTINVSNEVDLVSISALQEDEKAQIISGLGDRSLIVGNNLISIVVQAENGNTKTYNINIIRKNVLSSDSNLSSLNVSGQTLSPNFDPNTTSYSINVSNNITNLNVTAIASNQNATVTITGNKNLSVGKNNILIEVTAEDGSKKVYTISVTRNNTSNKVVSSSKSSNANLKSVTGISGLEFDASKTDYDILLPYEESNLNVSAEPEDSKSKVSISNTSIKNMEVGKVYTITIIVTAEDSTVKVYTINVKRSEYKSETDLDELVVNDKDLLINDNGEGQYSITVDKNTDQLDISAIPKSEDSTVKIIGNQKLKPGNNVVVIEVTDKNGFKRSYTIDVYKEGKESNIGFFKKYWLWIVVGFITLILIILIIFLIKNKKKKDRLEQLYAEIIDNKDDILYNSSNNSNVAGTDIYEPKHSANDITIKNDNMNLNNIIDDESVSQVKKEVTIIRDEANGDDDIEKEYKITEIYRKK